MMYEIKLTEKEFELIKASLGNTGDLLMDDLKNMTRIQGAKTNTEQIKYADEYYKLKEKITKELRDKIINGQFTVISTT